MRKVLNPTGVKTNKTV